VGEGGRRERFAVGEFTEGVGEVRVGIFSEQ